MAPISQELALRYLLELSTDIHSAVLMDQDGQSLVAVPEPSERLVRLSRDLFKEAQKLEPNVSTDALEVDIRLEQGTVFLVREGELVLVSVTNRFALPGLILHDMRVVLADLKPPLAVPQKAEVAE